MRPDRVDHGLHVGDSRSYGEHGILLGQHDAELPERAVAAVGVVLAAPELITVTLRPVVARGVVAVLGVQCGGIVHPLGGNHLPPLPVAALEVELAELRDVFRRDAETEAALVDAAWALLPGGAVDAERLEQARREVVEQALAGEALNDGREEVGRPGVVYEAGARFEFHRHGEDGAGPIIVVGDIEAGHGVLGVARAHAEEVPNAHGGQVVTDGRRGVIRQQRCDGVIHAQAALGDREAHGGGGEALAEREHRVRDVRCVGLPPSLGHDRAVAQQHEAVQIADLRVDVIDEIEDVLGCHALRLWGAVRQRILLHHLNLWPFGMFRPDSRQVPRTHHGCRKTAPR